MSQNQENQAAFDHIVVLDPALPVVEELLKTVAKPSLQIHRCESADQAHQTAQKLSPCLVICNVADARQINPTVKFVQKISKEIKKGNLKTMVLSRVKNAQLKQIISELGVTDFILDPIPARTLFFKFNLQINAITAIKKRRALLSNNTELVFKQDSAKGENGKITFKHQTAVFNRKAALKLQEDCFATTGSQPYKIDKKIAVEILGPSPSEGSWQKVPAKPNEKPRYRWVPNDPNAPEQKDSTTGWIHDGDEPVYQPENGRWLLTSEKPNFAYHRHGISQASKIEVNAVGVPQIADDSEHALKKIKEFHEKEAEKKRLAADKIETEAKISVGKEEAISTNEITKVKNLAPGESVLGDASGDVQSSFDPENDLIAAISGQLVDELELAIQEAKQNAADREKTKLEEIVPANSVDPQNREVKETQGNNGEEPRVTPATTESETLPSAVESASTSAAVSEEDKPKLEMSASRKKYEEAKAKKLAELAAQREETEKQNQEKLKENESRAEAARAATEEKAKALKTETAADTQTIKTFYKSLAELGDQPECAWEKCGNHYVYITPYHRGIKPDDLKAIFPLWIYSGSRAPVFDPTSGKFEFVQLEPRYMQSVKELPADRDEFVRATRNKLKEFERIKLEMARKWEEKRKPETLDPVVDKESSVDNPHENSSQKPGDSTDQTQTLEKTKASRGPSARTAEGTTEASTETYTETATEATVESTIEPTVEATVETTVEAPAEAGAELEAAEKGEQDQAAQAEVIDLAERRENLASTRPTDENEENISANKEPQEAVIAPFPEQRAKSDSESLEPSDDREAPAAATQDSTASPLNEKSAAPFDSPQPEQEIESKQESFSQEAEKMQNAVAEEPGALATAPAKAITLDPETEHLSKYEQVLIAKNPALKDVLLKRKKRKDSGQIKLDTTVSPDKGQQAVEFQNSLQKAQQNISEAQLQAFTAGVQVVISDAILKQIPLEARAEKIAGLIAKSIKWCHVSILTPHHAEFEDSGKMVASTNLEFKAGDLIPLVPTASIEQKPHILEGIYGATHGQLIGYLQISLSGQRKYFDTREQKITQRFAMSLAKYWESVPNKKKVGNAA